MDDIAIVGLAAAVLVGAHILGKRAAEPAPPKEDALVAACIKAGVPESVCRAGRSVLGGVVSAVQNATRSRESTNAGINGPVVESVSLAAYNAVSRTDANNVTYHVLTDRGVKHENGCVPIPGAAGWEKCAAGTRHIVDNGNLDDPDHYGGNTWWALVGLPRGFSKGGLLTGDPARDAYTFPWPASRAWPGPAGAGEKWMVRGQPVLCAPGTTVNSGRDHRTTPGPVCAPARSIVEPPPVVPPSGTPIYSDTRITESGARDRRTH